MIIEILHEWTTLRKGDFFDSRWRQTEPLAFNDFWNFYKTTLAGHNLDKKKDDRIKEASVGYLRNEFDRFTGLELPKLALQQKRHQLAFDPTANSQVYMVLEAATGRIDLLDLKALQHWLWQVKRKLYGLPVVNHLFLMLYEEHGGSGKSTLIRRIIEPFADYLLDWDFGDLAEDRNRLALKDNFIVLLDEMAKPERVAVDLLKHQITASHISCRIFGTQNVVHARQQCSFIGAANKQLDTLIVDSSSMRRFWQIQCQRKMDWSAVNSFDPVALWKEIDENKEDGYLVGEILDQTREAQKALITQDIVDEFLAAKHLIPADILAVAKVSNGDLYRHFHNYCRANGLRLPIVSNTFHKRLKGKLDATKWDRGKIKGYFVSEDHRLAEDDSLLDDFFGGD